MFVLVLVTGTQDMKLSEDNTVDYSTNNYRAIIEKNGDIVASTLYRNDKIILYEETTKVVKVLKDYGEFEFTKVIKRIRFDEHGKLIS